MGDTFRFGVGGFDAVKRVFCDERTSAVCVSSSGPRGHDGCVLRVSRLSPQLIGADQVACNVTTHKFATYSGRSGTRRGSLRTCLVS
jgi:hypothetical protein